MKLTLTLTVVLTVLFWIVHLLIAPNKNPDRYKESWDEPSIAIVGIVYMCITTVLMLIMINNIAKERFFLEGTMIFFAILTVLDIANIFIFYNCYSYKVKESMVDSLLFNFQKVRNALLIVLVIAITIKITIIGILCLIIVMGIFIGVFKL